MRILFDMDEVLVDFVTEALRIHNWDYERLEQVWSVGTWPIVEPMGLTVNEFWEPIHVAGEEFWLGLQPTPWIHELLHLVDSITDDWHIVSSPSQSPSSYSGKTKWLKRFFGKAFDRFAITPHKHLFAQPGVTLIDDHEATASRFTKAGGVGLVFPSRHNNLHWVSDPVDFLTKMFVGDILPRKE